jgi:hypothetical protein
MGILWMMPKAWGSPLPGLLRRARKDLPDGRLAPRMNKFTLLDDAAWGIGGAAAEGWVGQSGRRRQGVGLYVPGGGRRLLFGVGEGPAEAVAEAKQESIGAERKQFVKKFVSEQWILSCKSLGRPLVYHL